VNERSPILYTLTISFVCMSKREYLKALNDEIQKLNAIIDTKIMHQADYRREARRHKELLRQIRRERSNRTFGRVLSLFSA
jgi:hypothetical protein